MKDLANKKFKIITFKLISKLLTEWRWTPCFWGTHYLGVILTVFR